MCHKIYYDKEFNGINLEEKSECWTDLLNLGDLQQIHDEQKKIIAVTGFEIQLKLSKKKYFKKI